MICATMPRSRHFSVRRALLASTFSVVALGSLPALSQDSTIPVPTVTGPVPSDPFTSRDNNYTFFASDIALESHGYVEEEFFIEGIADVYDAPDGMPETPPSDTASLVQEGVPYKTRVVVRRPANAEDFNGTVLVEWLNVSDGFDGEYYWVQGHKHVIRDGYAYVGVSAQDNSMSHPDLGLFAFSAERYGDLDVTGGGDECCNDNQLVHDIFAQAGRAVQEDPDLLGGLAVENLIGIGMSQSGRRMTVYANYVHPAAPIYDAFMFQVHNSPVRDDLEVPVIKVLSESEYDNILAEEYDTDLRKSWWVAGSAHGDIIQRTGRNAVRLRDLGIGLTGNDACGPTGPFGESLTRTRVPIAHTINAAIHHLNANITEGVPLPAGIDPQWAPAEQWVERDDHGNALGGIRLAHIEVPTARSDGLECNNIGVWEPFTVEQLSELYSSPEDYVERVRDVVEANIADGYVLPEDGEETIAEAEASVIGTGLVCGDYCMDRSHYRLDFSSTGTLRLTTVYYNIVDGEELIAAVDAAHRSVAEGDSAEAPQNTQHFAFASHHLRHYLDLLEVARSDGRVTDTAAGVLSMQAHAILNGLAS